ncbi:MAG: division/cell wall cluster transcriptional repressor MraZ [Lachnospiraceae bacterium]|nr:division/cell wall cluster transcriptional repressor MraZ [Lachnospiraceae bacterium]
MTGLLLGQSEHSLDAKGRLIVPIRLREGLGSKFVMCNGHANNYIEIYPIEEWIEFAKDIATKDMTKLENRRKKAYFFGSSYTLEPDGQYRIVIPQKIRDEMHIDKEVVLVGMYNTVELWSKSEWEKHYSISVGMHDSKEEESGSSDETDSLDENISQ